MMNETGSPGEENAAKRIDRLIYVEAATNSLATAVEALTVVVKQNTAVVELLRAEVNRKPDDAELQAVAGFSNNERALYLRRLSLVVLVCALVSGAFSYVFARQNLHNSFAERNITFNASCVKLNMMIDILVQRDMLLSKAETLNETPGIGPTRQLRIQAYDRVSQGLVPLKKDCDALYPLER